MMCLHHQRALTLRRCYAHDHVMFRYELLANLGFGLASGLD